MKLRPEFVEHIPEQLDEGVLYVSINFGTVVHPGVHAGVERR